MDLHSLKENTTHGSIRFPLALYEWKQTDISWKVSPHWHEEMELIYLKKGLFRTWLNTREALIESPAIVCIHAGELHCLELPAGAMESAIVFNLNILSFEHYDAIQAKLLRPLMDGRLKMPPLLGESSPIFPQIRNFYEQIEQRVRQMNICPDEDELMKNSLYLQIKALLFNLLAILYQNNCLIPVREINNENEQQIQNLKKVLRYIGENYASPIRLEELAGLVNLNPQYFCRYFKENMGKTATEYINEVRIENAAEALAETSDKIITIAENTGFENMGYFIRRFKAEKGITPSEYRKRSKSQNSVRNSSNIGKKTLSLDNIM